MSKTCIDLHTPYLKSKFNKLIKSGVKEKDAELEIAIEEAKRIFNSLNNLKTKLGIKLSEEDEITNAIVTAKAEDFQDLSETFDLEGELKTKIAALEKIIKDAESEDAPATVKQELIEKGNAKLAEMKAELAALTKQDTPETEISGKEQLDALFGEVVTPQPTEKQETPIERLRRLAKEKIEESKLQSTSEFTYRGGTYTIDYNRNLLSPIPKTTAAQKNLIDSIGKQDIYDVINSTINSKDVYLVFNKNLNKFVVLDKNLNSIPLDESVVTSKAYQDAQNRCK
jgi:hypothetical protein